MNHQKAAKRSACDRCKVQRLRCLRAENTTEPCLRCTRADVECATGPARRLGRPRKAVATGNGRVEPDQSPRRDSSNHAAHCTATEHSTSIGHVVQPVITPAMWSPSPVGEVDSVYDFSSSSALWNDPNGLQLLLEEIDTPECLRPSDGVGTMNPQQSLLGHVEPENRASTCQSIGSRSGPECSDVLHAGGIRDYSERKDEMHQLTCAAHLSERITVVISHLVSLISPALPEPCFLLMDQPEINPIAQAFLCSEELIRIIQSLISSTPPSDESSISAASQIQSVELGDRRESPGMPIILLVLSNYSQLRQLYDLLFSHIYRTLCAISKEIIQSTRLKLVTCVGGLPPIHDMQADIYTRILVLVMQDHLQNLERHMGLLARYCLSSPDTPLDGAFGNKDLAPIFRRFIEHADSDKHTSCIYHIDSLQSNIQKVMEKLGGD